MRVLHVLKASGIAGTERHLLTLLPSLGADGYEISVCLLRGASGDAFERALLGRGIPVTSIDMHHDISPPAWSRITKIIRRDPPDLIHTHLIHGQVYGLSAAHRLGVPAVNSIHSTHDFYRNGPTGLAARGTGRWAMRTIAISKYVYRFIEEVRLATPGTVRVIHYGIDPTDWQSSDEERTRTRAHYNCVPNDVAVLSTSRLIPGKGHDLLLDALRFALQDAPNLKLLIAGTGPLETELRSIAASVSPSAIAFVGYTDNVRSLLAAADIFVFPTNPSLSEGFGLGALEASATGRPVIATRVGALPEIVIDGATGRVVAASDPAEMARSLVELASSPQLRARMGEAGIVRARSQFSLDQMVSATSEVYREAIGVRR